MTRSVRERALHLRKNGWSYNVIADKLGIAKSTLSHWLKDVPFQANDIVKRRIREGPAKSAALRHTRRLNDIKLAKEVAALEVGQLSRRDLLMLGIGLYMGEGSKIYESVRIINSDPNIIRLAVIWFREACGLNTSNFSVAIHVYPDMQPASSVEYWSRLTGIPKAQFSRTQVDKRRNKSAKKHRMLPHGTAHITIKSNGNKEYGVKLHRRIIGWIESVYKQAGIV